ncbi:MAG: hypothetical protein M3214_13615 [Actinomycetota bacterium]|nr:hypothetical protein [Actinomycetota bacterium]
MKAVDVQIITYAPTVFYHCQHCEVAFGEVGVGHRVHREQAREALPDDLRRDFDELSDRVHQVIERWGNRVHIRVIDAASLEGVWKSLRYRAGRYPVVIVNGHRADVSHIDSLGPLVEHWIHHPEIETATARRTGGN